MSVKRDHWILGAAILAAAGAGCGSGTNVHATATARGRALQFPRSTPAWLVAEAAKTAADLDDPNAKVVAVRLGAYPIVVLTGTFTCNLCSRPSNATPVQTGSYAGMRYDAATEQGTDFALAGSEQQAISGLCNGSPCTTARNR